MRVPQNLFCALLLICISQIHDSIQSEIKGRQSYLDNTDGYYAHIEKDPTLIDQIGHLYEGVRYGLKGLSSAVGAKVGYVSGGIAGVFHPYVSPKRAAAYTAGYLAPIFQRPFEKTRPLHDYAQRHIPGRKEFPYYAEEEGYAYHKY